MKMAPISGAVLILKPHNQLYNQLCASDTTVWLCDLKGRYFSHNLAHLVEAEVSGGSASLNYRR